MQEDNRGSGWDSRADGQRISGEDVELEYDISSLQNPQIKSDARLMDRRFRTRSGLMSIEGIAEFTLAWESGIEIVRLYICPELFREGEEILLGRVKAGGVSPISIPVKLMKKLAYREHPDGWFCVAGNPYGGMDKIPGPEGKNCLYIVAEDLEKPGNLGAILRSAEASGVRGVIAAESRTDLSNPNVVRASKGVNFAIPVAESSNEECYRWLKDRGVSIAIADPGDNLSIWDAEPVFPLAVVLGAENEGVSGFWRERADMRLLIPMTGRINSLNVAQAGTIIMYEVLRRRLRS